MSSAQTPAAATETARVQLNARVGKDIKRNVKTDAAATDLAIDLITEAILAKFYKDHPKLEERTEIYRRHGIPAAAAAAA